MDVYFFNWTNPEDITNHSTKPILEELGPYRFIEHPTKVDIEWHDANATVSYRKKSLYYFDEEGSNGSLDDVISSINIVAVVSYLMYIQAFDRSRSRSIQKSPNA